MHYYQHNIGDFNSATRHLTRVERSLYRDLIELYYDTESPLTGDIKKLSRKVMARTNEEIDAINDVLEEFFYLDNGVYLHIRCDAEIEKYHANNSAKARAGKASAESRKTKKAAKGNNKATEAQQNSTRVEQVLNTCPTEAQQNSTKQEPITNNQEPITIEKEKEKENPRPPSDEKFTMSDDWNPEHDTWEANSFRAGSPPLNPDSLINFVLYWSSEQKKFTEAQWQGKLLSSLKREKKSENSNAKNQRFNQPKPTAIDRVNRAGQDYLRRKAEAESDAEVVGGTGSDLRQRVRDPVRGESIGRMGETINGDYTRPDSAGAEYVINSG